MSASLVGSEMCIRDRLPSKALAFRFEAFHGREELEPSRQQARRPCGSRCLLYTSDAADDM
eukprot:7792911-Alexandrium_andersonii.AAC.1